MNQVIVVGGGLAGMSAAHTVLEQGGNVVVIDKNAFFGGNSTKATSGINGAQTRTQRKLNIPDSPEIFEQDIIKGGANQPDLVKVLAYESAPAVDWLIDGFNLDLSLVSRLGGHSQPRTHRGAQKFPGMTITYALMEKIEEIAEETPNRAKLIMKARVTKLVTDGTGAVIGVEYEQAGKTFKEAGSVIVCTGGYGADYDADGLLTKHRPDLAHLPTTNGDHCTGDGIKAAMAVGADTIDLNWVQVHPTGLVHPDEPDAKIKFLAAEALRGVGGVIVDADGKRIANELGRRDYVTGRMWKSKGPFRLCLNSKASKEIEWHCKHYKGRGLMKYYETGTDLAKDMGIDPAVLKATLDDHSAIAEKQMNDPDGGKYDAYPSGKSHDPWGKKFFHNVPTTIEDNYHVGIITPVVHYTMGGLKVNPASECVDTKGNVILGLFGAGEAIGGVHGENRLGGNSLLDCVVFGRVAGRSAARQLMAHNINAVQKSGALAKL